MKTLLKIVVAYLILLSVAFAEKICKESPAVEVMYKGNVVQISMSYGCHDFRSSRYGYAATPIIVTKENNVEFYIKVQVIRVGEPHLDRIPKALRDQFGEYHWLNSRQKNKENFLFKIPMMNWIIYRLYGLEGNLIYKGKSIPIKIPSRIFKKLNDAHDLV